MGLEENIKSVEIKDSTKGTSDFSQWGVFAWKLFRSLVVIVAGTTVIYLICRWLGY